MTNGITIDGVSHRLVHGGGKDRCDKCSLWGICCALRSDVTLCVNVLWGDNGDYFVEEGKA